MKANEGRWRLMEFDGGLLRFIEVDGSLKEFDGGLWRLMEVDVG